MTVAFLQYLPMSFYTYFIHTDKINKLVSEVKSAGFVLVTHKQARCFPLFPLFVQS